LTTHTQATLGDEIRGAERGRAKSKKKGKWEETPLYWKTLTTGVWAFSLAAKKRKKEFGKKPRVVPKGATTKCWQKSRPPFRALDAQGRGEWI